MQMFEKTREFHPDSLIASHEFPIITECIALKAGQGVLKRGSLITKGVDGIGYIAGTSVDVTPDDGDPSTMEMKVFGILTDDVDTGSTEEIDSDNVPSTCYVTGIFNRDAIAVKEESQLATYEYEMRTVSLFLQNVQNY